MLRIAVLLFTVILVCAAAMAQTGSKAAGHWEGKIQIPEHELQVAVDLDRNAKGVWVGSMSVAGSTAVDVPLTNVAVDGSSVKFAANLGVPASFSGKVSEDGKGISGTAASTAGEAPFQLARAGEASVKIPSPSSTLTKEFAGDWEGSLDANGNVLRIGMKLSAGDDGKAVARLISYDQGNAEFGADTVTIDGKELQFDIRMISGHYKGALGDNGEIAGEWVQGPGRLPLTFKRPAPKP